MDENIDVIVEVSVTQHLGKQVTLPNNRKKWIKQSFPIIGKALVPKEWSLYAIIVVVVKMTNAWRLCI